MTAIRARPPSRRGSSTRLSAVGGLVGPAVFVADWAILGARRSGYSPLDDAISRLAERGASTRPVMTGGFVVYGLGLISYGMALRRGVPGPAGYFAVATGITTLGVAAFPLGSSPSNEAHAVVAAAGYVTLAAVPLAAASRSGSRALSTLTSLVTAASLLTSTTGAPAPGLTQRIGLSVGDAWVMISAARLLRPRP